MVIEKSKLPAVSIGIPFYNAEATLLDAVRSVFAQTHQNWELILLDDGSTDKSLQIAQSIRDARVRVYSDGQNRRLATRLNQITRLAKYDFIARMDADDLMMPERIEKLLTILNTQKEYDLVSCGTFSISHDKTLIGFRGKEVSSYTFDGLLNNSQGFVHAALVARKCWYERNQYDETIHLGQDTYLWLTSAKKNDFRAISIADPLYIYREEGNVTKKKLLNVYRMGRIKVAPLIDSNIIRTKYIFVLHIKSIALKVLDKFGLLGYLLKRRNNSFLNEKLTREYTAGLKIILEKQIPQF